MKVLFGFLSCIFMLSVSAKSPLGVNEHNRFMPAIYNIDSDYLSAIDTVLSHDYKCLYSAYGLFWRGIENDDKQCMQQAGQVLSVLNPKKISDEYLSVTVALLKMRLALINKQFLSAISSQQVVRDFFLMPENLNDPYAVFLWGMYHYFVSYGREKSLFYRAILSSWPPAQRDLGVLYLQQSLNQSSLLIATESHYFLGRIYLEYENQPQKASPLFLFLTQHYPHNHIYKQFLDQCD